MTSSWMMHASTPACQRRVSVVGRPACARRLLRSVLARPLRWARWLDNSHAGLMSSRYDHRQPAPPRPEGVRSQRAPRSIAIERRVSRARRTCPPEISRVPPKRPAPAVCCSRSTISARALLIGCTTPPWRFGPRKNMAASALLLGHRLVIRRVRRMLVLPPDPEINSTDQQQHDEMVCFNSSFSVARFTDRPALGRIRALHVRAKSDTHRRQVQLGPCVCLGHSQVCLM